MRTVIFHRLAKRELKEASAWYAARSEQARQRFREAVSDAVDRISNDPLSPAILVGHYRYVQLRRFPYLIIYEVWPEDSVLIVAVAHTSRRPGYWRRRR
jgi:plasmid stabilization system protein ParE